MNVSRETRERLGIYVEELTRWQAAVNLVSPRSLDEIWTRHIEDSLQLVDHVPDRELAWLDLGSGAGLPGRVIAAARPSHRMMLMESDGRKCAFLRNASAKMSVRADVLEGRIERGIDRLPYAPEVITARGLARLTTLFAYAQKQLEGGAIGLFPKGRAVADELTEARESWTFRLDLIPSRTDPDGRICRVSELRPLGATSRLNG